MLHFGTRKSGLGYRHVRRYHDKTISRALSLANKIPLVAILLPLEIAFILLLLLTSPRISLWLSQKTT